MQIDLLMAQINPHFVYNTLNTVIYLCHANRSRQAADVAQALIAILQDAIRTGEGAVQAPLAEEKRIIDKYVLIQQTRYPGRFRLTWELDETLLEHPVPRMTLQPLVENAILHGIVPSDRDSGVIVVRAYCNRDQIFLEVEDNGKGMQLHAGETLPSPKPTSPERTRGIGLSNIRERLMTDYGSDAGLEMISHPGQGTLVRIWLPLRTAS
jgi:two-component system sensor histidine kinase YesM